MVGKLVGLLVSGLSAVIIGGIGTPVVWLILRVIGLTDAVIGWLGQFEGLMIGGGLLIGALIGGTLSAVIARTLERTNKPAFIIGIIGGAIGGYASSLMFFSIVVIL